MIDLRWRAWHGDTTTPLEFPAGWQVTVAAMADAPPLTPAEVETALRHAIGSPPLAELAAGRRSAVIVVEDITRPLDTAALLPLIVAELSAAGLRDQDISLLIALGSHTPMERHDLAAKLGQETLARHIVRQSSPHENQHYLGQTSRGTPIYISGFYLQADLRLALGSITPQAYAGFGGGAKTVAVGAAGIETLYANHMAALQDGPHAGDAKAENVACRLDLEEIAAAAGVDFSINGVVNSRRQLAGLFAGDVVAAQRAGAAFARRIYATPLPPPADIVIFNAYPKDTNLLQSVNAFNVANFDPDRLMYSHSSAVVITAACDGAGLNYLESPGMRGELRLSKEMMRLGPHGLIVFSPHLSSLEARHLYPEDTVVFETWPQVVAELARRHGSAARVNLYPYAALQVADVSPDPKGF
jgi:nickel-dependent lactate racemase